MKSFTDRCNLLHPSSVWKDQGLNCSDLGLDLRSPSQPYYCSRFVSCVPSLKMEVCIQELLCWPKKKHLKRRIKFIVSKRSYCFYSRKKRMQTLTSCLNSTKIYSPYSTPVYSFVSSKDTRVGTLHEKKPNKTKQQTRKDYYALWKQLTMWISLTFNSLYQVILYVLLRCFTNSMPQVKYL